MSKKSTINILIIIAIIIGAILIFQKSRNATEESSSEKIIEEMETKSVNKEESTGLTISYTDSGYSPSAITIKMGDTITFQNDSSKDMWPATAMHPTHTVYPGSDIEKCDGNKVDDIFDACDEISPGNSWSFQFNEIGDWKYHDHINPKNFGSIIVE